MFPPRVVFLFLYFLQRVYLRNIIYRIIPWRLALLSFLIRHPGHRITLFSRHAELVSASVLKLQTLKQVQGDELKDLTMRQRVILFIYNTNFCGIMWTD
jgi:hypothetical protein